MQTLFQLKTALNSYFSSLTVPEPAKTTIVKGESYNPTTTYDIELHDGISKVLSLISDDPIISEESELRTIPKTCKRFWLIDPIDGSREFAMGIPECVSSIALIDASSGQPIFGVIYDIYRKKAFYSTDSLESRQVPRPKKSILLFSRSESKLGLQKYFEPIAPLISEIKNEGSIAYKILKCTMEPYDQMVISLQPKSKWDVAGAAAFVKNHPHLRLTDLQGRDILFSGQMTQLLSGVICCHRDLYDDVFSGLETSGGTRVENLRKPSGK